MSVSALSLSAAVVDQSLMSSVIFLPYFTLKVWVMEYFEAFFPYNGFMWFILAFSALLWAMAIKYRHRFSFTFAFIAASIIGTLGWGAQGCKPDSVWCQAEFAYLFLLNGSTLAVIVGFAYGAFEKAGGKTDHLYKWQWLGPFIPLAASVIRHRARERQTHHGPVKPCNQSDFQSRPDTKPLTQTPSILLEHSHNQSAPGAPPLSKEE